MEVMNMYKKFSRLDHAITVRIREPRNLHHVQSRLLSAVAPLRCTLASDEGVAVSASVSDGTSQLTVGLGDHNTVRAGGACIS